MAKRTPDLDAQVRQARFELGSYDDAGQWRSFSSWTANVDEIRGQSWSKFTAWYVGQHDDVIDSFGCLESLSRKDREFGDVYERVTPIYICAEAEAA